MGGKCDHQSHCLSLFKVEKIKKCPSLDNFTKEAFHSKNLIFQNSPKDEEFATIINNQIVEWRRLLANKEKMNVDTEKR